jgi:hypothetical protein
MEQQDKKCDEKDNPIFNDVEAMNMACNKCKQRGKAEQCRHLTAVPPQLQRPNNIPTASPEQQKKFNRSLDYYMSLEYGSEWKNSTPYVPPSPPHTIYRRL